MKISKNSTIQKHLEAIPGILLAIVIGLIFALIFRTFIQFGIVNGTSMYDTYKNGERVIILKFDKSVNRGDVVALKNTPVGNELLIKRVIAVGGDTIKFVNGKYYLNSKLVNEPYVDEILTSNNITSYTLKKDEIFVAGDNRIDSYDSRYFGPLTIKKNLVGVIFHPKMK